MAESVGPTDFCNKIGQYRMCRMLFIDLVRAGQKGWRDFDPERLSCFEINS